MLARGHLLLLTLLFLPSILCADSVSVRYVEGISRGFIALFDQSGHRIGTGDLQQVAKSGRVSSHLHILFEDKSVYDDQTVFTQRGVFRLLTDHVIQKGPIFKTPMETSINASTGQVTVDYTDDDGHVKHLSQRMKLPPDVSNGVVFTLIKDIPPNSQKTVSYVATTPKPRVVKLVFTSQPDDTFTAGGLHYKAMQYTMKVQIGGIAGVVAPVLGKQPPDTLIWVIGGEAPTFAASEGPLYGGGPVWKMKLVSPESSAR